MGIYSLAAQQLVPEATVIRAAYWFTTTRGGFKFFPQHYFDINDDKVRERFREGLTAIVAGIGSGLFPANPGPIDREKPANCTFCDFDSLCAARRTDLWERKQSDPLLAPYLALGDASGEERPMNAPATTVDPRQAAFNPIDDDARRVIRDELEETLFVEASAGTGKTASLVARVVNLVLTGKTTLDRIAAITFTEAAAAELRDRVRQGLEEAAASDSRDAEERDRCRQGLVDLDQAAIQTLHSFASALLHERPLEARLPPSFETTDEIAAGIKFNEAWDTWLDGVLEPDSDLAPHLALALTLHMTLTQLKDVALALHRNYADLSGVTFAAPPGTPSSRMAELQQARPELERLCEYSKLQEGDLLYRHVQSKLGVARRLAEARPGSPIMYRLLCKSSP